MLAFGRCLCSLSTSSVHLNITTVAVNKHSVKNMRQKWGKLHIKLTWSSREQNSAGVKPGFTTLTMTMLVWTPSTSTSTIPSPFSFIATMLNTTQQHQQNYSHTVSTAIWISLLSTDFLSLSVLKPCFPRHDKTFYFILTDTIHQVLLTSSFCLTPSTSITVHV